MLHLPLPAHLEQRTRDAVRHHKKRDAPKRLAARKHRDAAHEGVRALAASMARRGPGGVSVCLILSKFVSSEVHHSGMSSRSHQACARSGYLRPAGSVHEAALPRMRSHVFGIHAQRIAPETWVRHDCSAQFCIGCAEQVITFSAQPIQKRRSSVFIYFMYSMVQASS